MANLSNINNNFIVTDDGVGRVLIGATGTPTSALTISGQQELLQLTRGGASDTKWFFSADSTRLFIAENTSATANIKLTINENGNVGIGTSTPGNKLVVRGPSSDATGGDNNVAQFEGPSGTNGFQVYVNDTLNNTGIQTKNGDSFIINPGGGNVGIGVTSPGRPLNVVSAYSAGTVTTSLKLATLGGYNGGSGTALEFGQDQGNYATWVSGKISSPRTGDNYGGSLTFSTNRNLSPTGIEEAMRIDNLGNVGIGTTYTPFAKLTVSASDRGNGIETQVTTGGGLQYILAYSRTVGATGYLDLALAAKTLNLQTGNGTTKLSISSSGTVTLAGDKTINTSSSLRLNAGGGTLFLDSTTNIILRTGGTTPTLTLSSSQNATFAGSILFSSNTAYVQDYAIRKGSDALIFSTGTGGYYFNGTGNGATFFRITGTGTIFMSALGGYPGSNADVRYDTSSKELYYQTSSKRYKTNIVNLESSLDKINLLRPVRYKDINTKKPACGLIAEETVKVIPEVVFSKEIEGFDKPQVEGINYTDLVPFLIKSIQELEARIKILEK
jgi:hypothetical protein